MQSGEKFGAGWLGREIGNPVPQASLPRWAVGNRTCFQGGPVTNDRRIIRLAAGLALAGLLCGLPARAQDSPSAPSSGPGWTYFKLSKIESPSKMMCATASTSIRHLFGGGRTREPGMFLSPARHINAELLAALILPLPNTTKSSPGLSSCRARLGGLFPASHRGRERRGTGHDSLAGVGCARTAHLNKYGKQYDPQSTSSPIYI